MAQLAVETSLINLDHFIARTKPSTALPLKSIANMPAPVHLISKVGDPLFALFIGLSAATLRINREEKEAGRSTQQTIDAGLRRVGLSSFQGATSAKQN